MKNKNMLVYTGLLGVGLFFGWFFFGTSLEELTHVHKENSNANQKWTCAMHPQIMQIEKGDCPICGMDLILAENISDGLLADQFKLTENAMALANIQTTIIGNTKVGENATILSGIISENEDNLATQSAHFNGRIEKLYITTVGEKVTKGQKIAEIYSADLIVAQQELITSFNLRESQPELYKVVRNKFKNWKISESELNEILKTGEIQTSFSIYANVSGVITEIPVQNGDHIVEGKPIVKVANLSSVWANFDVYEHQINLFKKGQKITVTTNIYPEKIFEGKVDFINPNLNLQTRTVNLRVVLNNKNKLFKPGMFVKGKIVKDANKKDKRIIIPASAVLWTGERSLVYVKANSNSPVFEMRELTLGNRLNENYEIIDGLVAGEEIVTHGTFTVDAAAQLSGKKSMMNRSNVDKKLEGTKTVNIELSTTFQNSLKKTLPFYFELTSSFVASDSEKISSIAKNLAKALQEIDLSIAKNTVSTNISESISILKVITESFDLEKQRQQFSIFNEHYIALIKNTHQFKNKIYLQFCPMANNNKGAFWLSDTKKVYNPYYGEAMLSCGEVKRVIE